MPWRQAESNKYRDVHVGVAAPKRRGARDMYSTSTGAWARKRAWHATEDKHKRSPISYCDILCTCTCTCKPGHQDKARQSKYTWRQLLFSQRTKRWTLTCDTLHTDYLPTELPRQVSWAGWIFKGDTITHAFSETGVKSWWLGRSLQCRLSWGKGQEMRYTLCCCAFDVSNNVISCIHLAWGSVSLVV